MGQFYVINGSAGNQVKIYRVKYFLSPVRFAHSSRKARKEMLIFSVYTPDYFTTKDTKSTKGSADELLVMSD
jgi:hypothetical protein